MLGEAMHTTIKTLWEKGLNKSAISKATGHDWKTVSKIIRAIQAGKTIPTKKSHPRILDSYHDKLIEWIEMDLSGIRIHQNLLSEGVNVGYSTVKNFIADAKRHSKIFMRIHTAPGEEAQVDFGYVGFTLDNQAKRRKTWVFNMRLSYSRLDFYKKVYDQKVETFILCHIEAFQYFSGVPRTIKIDNLKAAILQANFYEPIYQQLYKQFAEFYHFQPLPCRIYQPNDKGKVESGIKYVKINFFSGRHFKDSDDVDRQLSKWLETANHRIHGTTKKIPREQFEAQEKSALKVLPIEEFILAKTGKRKVYHDCHVYINSNYYSVPYRYVGKEVNIEVHKNLIKIYFEQTLVATHIELNAKGEFSTESSHYPKYKCQSQTEYQEKYQAKMAKIGNFAEQIFFGMVHSYKTCWSRPVQGILSLTKTFSPEVINLSCKRALAYGAYEYQVIKNICRNGSYVLPVEFT
jgi:transposase